MKYIFLIIILYLSVMYGSVFADTFARENINIRPTPSSFSICHGYTCTNVSHIGLAKSQWKKIQAIFSPLPVDSEDERHRIARAVGELEIMVGAITDTSNDKAKTLENVIGLYLETQMDCIDESTNTTIYLMMMMDNHLLKWHVVEDNSTRGFFIFGWPHTTAVIRDTASDELYAVDSWFEDNGKPPYILLLAAWKEGWEP